MNDQRNTTGPKAGILFCPRNFFGKLWRKLTIDSGDIYPCFFKDAPLHDRHDTTAALIIRLGGIGLLSDAEALHRGGRQLVVDADAVPVRLALFAASGVTFGTLFSMPVATFLSLVLILLLQLSGFISAAAQVDRATFVANVAPFGAASRSPDADTAATVSEPSFAARAAATALFYAYRGTYLTLRPLLEDRTLDALSTGTHIPPRDLLRNFLQQGVVLPLLLALLSTAVLRRREWALPAIS